MKFIVYENKISILISVLFGNLFCVESQEDVDLLVSLFYTGQDEDDDSLYVDADDVFRILKEFIGEKISSKRFYR